MKFRLLRGVHVEDGTLYEPNQIVDSSRDLVKLFVNKFERVTDLDVEADESSVSCQVENFGEDVTEEFREADGLNVKVYRDNRRYYISTSHISDKSRYQSEKPVDSTKDLVLVTIDF